MLGTKNTSCDCLITGRKPFGLLRDRAVKVFCLLLNDVGIFLIDLKTHDILDITTQSGTRQTTQDLPCIFQGQSTFTLSIGRRHHNRLHVNRRNTLLIAIEPAGIQKLVHISADPQPLHGRRQNNAIHIL